jgi:hypothetical protein
MPESTQLVPPVDRAQFRPTGRSLTVDEVRGKEQKDVLGVQTISVPDAAVREALAGTLIASGMFREVSLKPGGELRLSTQVIAQELWGYGTLVLLVRYRLVETGSGRTVWVGNIFSEKSISVSEIFAGTERTQRLREIVFRDNFAQVAAQLDRVLR